MSNLKSGVSVGEATHVKCLNGQVKKITSKYGVYESGRVASSKDGGFGVYTEDGQRVTMWEANAYLKEEK